MVVRMIRGESEEGQLGVFLPIYPQLIGKAWVSSMALWISASWGLVR